MLMQYKTNVLKEIFLKNNGTCSFEAVVIAFDLSILVQSVSEHANIKENKKHKVNEQREQEA